jgi:hypothetical protein
VLASRSGSRKPGDPLKYKSLYRQPSETIRIFELSKQCGGRRRIPSARKVAVWQAESQRDVVSDAIRRELNK